MGKVSTSTSVIQPGRHEGSSQPGSKNVKPTVLKYQNGAFENLWQKERIDHRQTRATYQDQDKIGRTESRDVGHKDSNDRYNVKKPKGERVDVERFNCSKRGHIAKYCHEIKKETRNCFECGKKATLQQTASETKRWLRMTKRWNRLTKDNQNGINLRIGNAHRTLKQQERNQGAYSPRAYSPRAYSPRSTPQELTRQRDTLQGLTRQKLTIQRLTPHGGQAKKTKAKSEEGRRIEEPTPDDDLHNMDCQLNNKYNVYDNERKYENSNENENEREVKENENENEYEIENKNRLRIRENRGEKVEERGKSATEIYIYTNIRSLNKEKIPLIKALLHENMILRLTET